KQRAGQSRRNKSSLTRMEQNLSSWATISEGRVNSAVDPAPAGELRLHGFRSRIFRNTRNLRVWLPPGYHLSQNSGRYYPVFYLNDGQNLFDPATSYIGVDWQAGRTADRLFNEGRIPPIIMVGIDNAHKDRAKEYLSYPSFDPPILRPKGKKYPD